MATIPYLHIEGEIWKPIPGFDNRYEASTEGNIRTIKGRWTNGGLRPYLLKPSPGSYGYMYVGVMVGKKIKKFGLHQLVSLAFHGPCPDGLEPDHIDMDKANNRPDNLEYVSHAENLRRARATKSWSGPKGTANYNAKLTDAAVRAIRLDTRPQRVVAAEHGISGVAVCMIRQRKTWRHVED